MKKYLFLTLFLFIASLNFNLLLNPYNLVTGGTQGLAIIINKIISIRPSLIILIINIIALFLSYILLNLNCTKSAIYSSLIYPLLIKLTSNITFYLKLPTLIISILAGTIFGLTNTYIYKLNFSSGGINIIHLLLEKYLHIKISICNFITNTSIIILGIFIFGLTNSLYSILVIIIGSFILHKLTTRQIY